VDLTVIDTQAENFRSRNLECGGRNRIELGFWYIDKSAFAELYISLALWDMFRQLHNNRKGTFLGRQRHWVSDSCVYCS